MDVDFKFNNKILARDLIKCLERGGDVPKEKYGIRKGKKSIMHAVKKQLLYNVIHLQRQPYILCSNGSKYCYDRIVHSVSSMEIQ